MSDASNELIAENRWERYRERTQMVQVSGDTEIAIETVTRVLRGVQAQHLDEYKAAILATETYTSPLYDQGKRTLTGTWKNGGVFSQYDRFDNNQIQTYNLYQLLYRTSDTTMPYFVTERTCRYLVEAQIYFGATTPPTLPPAGSGVTYRLIGRDLDQDTGAWTFTLERRTRQYQENGSSPVLVESSAGREVLVRQQLGVTNETLESMTAPDGETRRRQIQINEDCTKDVDTEVVRSIEQMGEDNRATMLYESNGTVTRNTVDPEGWDPPTQPGIIKTYTKTPNPDGSYDVTVRTDTSPVLDNYETIETTTSSSTQTGAENDPVVKVAATANPSVGTTVRFRSRRNEDGTYSWTEVLDVSPVLQNVETRESTTSGGSTSTGVENDRTAKTDAATSPSVGVIIRFISKQNEDGTYSWTEIADTSPVLTSSESIYQQNKTTTATGVKNDRTEPQEPLRATGEKVTFRKSQNEDGTWDHITIVESTTSGLTAAGGVVNSCGDVLGTDSAQNGITAAQKTIAYNAAIAAMPPATRMVWSERENDDGSWDFSYRYETAPALTSNSTTVRAKGGITETHSRNVEESALSTFPPVAAQGETITLRQDKNPDCSWDEYIRTETAPSLTGDVTVVRADYTSSVTRNLNAAARDNNATAGTNEVLQVTNDENPDGTWNTSRSVTTPQAQYYTGEYTTNNRTASITIFKNYTGDAVLALVNALNPDNINNVSAVPNEFGLFDGSVTSVQPSSSAGGSGDSEIPKGGAYYVTIGTVRYTYTSRLTSFESKAQQHVQESSGITEDNYGNVNPKPGYQYVGKGKYLAWKVVVT